jgi:hypothetical protein
MFSSERGLPAHLAVSGFLPLLLSWMGAAVYSLARRPAGLPRPLAWLAGLGGVAGGEFSRLLGFYGHFGQMTTLFGFLLLLRASLAGPALPAPGS